MTTAAAKAKRLPALETEPTDSLGARTDAARERVSTLRAERAAAALACERFDHASLRDAEDELASLEDATGEKVRRARVAAAEAEADRIARLRRELAALEDERRAAIEEAEALCRGMVDAIMRADKARADILSRLAAVGAPRPIGLDGNEQATRLSRKLSAALMRLAGSSSHWGELALRSGIVSAGEAWVASEAAATEAIMTEGKHDGAAA